jgi:hypothetical protein
MIGKKYCRICWNSSNWREPTGEAAGLEMGESFVVKHGFGHEEWLFDFSSLVPNPEAEDGLVKYGFLQPINKYYQFYRGHRFDILLYTVTPERTKVAIGDIRDALVPEISELSQALGQMRKSGGLDQMIDDLARLNLTAPSLRNPKSPADVFNVRFDPTNVTFYDPRILIPTEHKIQRMNRYQPLDWDDPFPTQAEPQSGKQQSIQKTRRSEVDRKRAAISGTGYSPHHVRLQNAMFDYLVKLYGNDAVGYEDSFVDLSLTEGDQMTFYEIKIAPTPKKCIRDAFGQLLEYAMYPNAKRADRFVVVGDGNPTPDDKDYLTHLRNTFNIPIYYSRWIWKSRKLDAPV